MSFSGSAEDLEQTFGISVAKWDYKTAQKHLRKTFSEKRVFRLAYRPFDFRFIYYDSDLVFSHREGKMSHLLNGDNIALVCASRLSSKGFNHILPADCLVEMKYSSHDTNSRIFPVFLHSDTLLNSKAEPNMSAAASGIAGGQIKQAEWLEFNEAILAVLNSTKYRTRYFEEIKNDFPSIPLLNNTDLRQALANLGRQLIRVQLLRAEIPDTAFPFEGALGEEIETPKLHGDRLRISHSAYFVGVGREIFEFSLAGYQISKNWVSAGNKSGIQRKGTVLTRKDAQLYRRVLYGIQQTIAVRALIDQMLAERLRW